MRGRWRRHTGSRISRCDGPLRIHLPSTSAAGPHRLSRPNDNDAVDLQSNSHVLTRALGRPANLLSGRVVGRPFVLHGGRWGTWKQIRCSGHAIRDAHHPRMPSVSSPRARVGEKAIRDAEMLNCRFIPNPAHPLRSAGRTSRAGDLTPTCLHLTSISHRLRSHSARLAPFDPAGRSQSSHLGFWRCFRGDCHGQPHLRPGLRSPPCDAPSAVGIYYKGSPRLAVSALHKPILFYFAISLPPR